MNKEVTITEQTRLPLGLVKVILVGTFAVLCFCLSGAWWAATVSEKLSVIKAEQEKVTAEANRTRLELTALQLALDRVVNSGTDTDRNQNRQLIELQAKIAALEQKLKTQ